MSHSSHGRALFDHIIRISNPVELVVPSRSFPREYSLVKIPLTNLGGGSFGLAVIHKGSRSVPYWMQVSILSRGMLNEARLML